MLKRMLNKARALLDKIRKWNASEDNRFGSVGYTRFHRGHRGGTSDVLRVQ
jgi:hypothetical protein